MTSVSRDELNDYLSGLLEVARFKDYCPNGLQVEGRARISRLVTGVTASQALLDAAIVAQADAVLVHHGYFWRGEEGRITGIRRQRLATLLSHEINLFAYHLPLDAHPQLGNNAQLARLLGWTVARRFGDQDMVWMGQPQVTSTVGDVVAKITSVLAREPLLIGDPARPVRRIAWCSGGAQSWFEQAIAEGADCFVSGEISEPTVHLARESGVAYLAAGHHASERYGIKALGEHLMERFDINCVFVDIDNPV